MKKDSQKKVLLIIGFYLIVCVIVITLIVFYFISHKKANVYYTNMDGYINDKCNNYISYIKYDKNYDFSLWNSSYDIGSCDGVFVQNTFSERKKHEGKESSNYKFYHKKLQINYIDEVNSLFDNVLYYDPNDYFPISSVNVLLYGNSVQDIDNYSESLVETIKLMNYYYYEQSGRKRDSIALHVCFTPDQNFVTNDYYKAFIVKDMFNLSYAKKVDDYYRFKVEYNADKINISECTKLVYIDTFSKPEKVKELKDNPILVEE